MLDRRNIPWEDFTPKYKFHNAIADPPFGLKEGSKNHKSRNTPIKQKNGSILSAPDPIYIKSEWDNKIPSDLYFDQIKKYSRNQIIFGANYFPVISGVPSFKPPRRDKFDEFLNNFPSGYIIWDKCNGSNDFNDCEVIYTSYDFKSYVLPYMWNGMMQGKSIVHGRTMQGNKKLNQKRIHPTEKPILIYRYLIQMFSGPGEVNLDTHGGSESNTIAHHQEGVDLVILEKDTDIFKQASDRLKQYKIIV